jgi:hypothetical protein
MSVSRPTSHAAARMVFALFAALFFTDVAIAADETCKIADSSIQAASTIRKLTIKKPVPCFVHNKDQVKGYILHSIDTKIPEKKLEMEGLVYKALGFIPPDFDYQKGIVELYLNQIGGYYDSEGKHFIMAGWLPAMLQSTVAVHEMTHALQDQYFDLQTFMDEKRYSGDELLSRSALVEGDATAVMLDYARHLVGQQGIEKEANVEAMMLQNVIGSSLVSGMNAIPSSLQMTLIFPYTSGLRFAHELLRRGSYEEVNKAFRSAPRSTEEILHPEKFFEKKADFAQIDSSELVPSEMRPDSVPVYQDTFGEFAISTLLSNFLSDKGRAATAAAGWGGDRIAVFVDESAKLRTIVWKLNWDSEKDAEEFYREYGAALKKLYPAFKDALPKEKAAAGSPSFVQSGQTVVLTIRDSIS